MRHSPHSWSMKWQAPNQWQAATRNSLLQWTVEKRQWIWRHATHSTPQTHIPRIKIPRKPISWRVVKKWHSMIMSKIINIYMSKRHIKWKMVQRGLTKIKYAMHNTHHIKTLNTTLLGLGPTENAQHHCTTFWSKVPLSVRCQSSHMRGQHWEESEWCNESNVLWP